MLSIACCGLSYAQEQRGIIKGIVTDSSTGETLPFATVIIEDTKLGTATNVHGFYIITNVPYGVYRVKVSSVGYETQTKQIIVMRAEATTSNFHLSPKPIELQPIVRTVERRKLESETNISVQTLGPEEIKLVPPTVESDLFRVLKVFPGVIATSDVSSQFYVRGGGGDQNLILLDGMTVYNPFHALGLFSIFDADAIKSVDFFTGGFGAEYGTRLSSVLNITTRDGNKNRFSGKLSASLLTGKALLEGPLGFWDGAWMISARKSYFDAILKKFVNRDLPLSFYDVIAKVNTRWSDDTQLAIQGFLSDDNIRNPQITEPNFHWWNRAFGISVSQLLSDRFLAQGTFSRSFFSASVDPQQSSTSPQSTSIEDVYFNTSFTYFTDSHDEIHFGFMYNLPEMSYQLVNAAGFAVDTSGTTVETALWGKYKWLAIEKFALEIGLRLNYISLLDEFKYAFEPRISFKLQLHPRLAFKGSFGRYRQRMITVSNEDDVISLFEAWIPIQTTLPPEEALHYVLGFEGTLWNFLDVSVVGYYKSFNNLLGYNRDKIDRHDPDYVPGHGKASGVELFLKATTESFSGLLSYTLGSSSRTTNNYTYPPRYDRTHSLNFVAGYRFPGGWEFNIHWEFGSGLPFTRIIGFYDRLTFDGFFDSTYVHETGKPYTILGNKNEGRLPSYHRLDIGIAKVFFVGQFKVSLEASVVNVYNRKNIFYFNRDTGEQVNMLPMMPTVNLRVEF